MRKKKSFFGFFSWNGKLTRFWQSFGIFSLGPPKSFFPNLGRFQERKWGGEWLMKKCQICPHSTMSVCSTLFFFLFSFFFYNQIMAFCFLFFFESMVGLFFFFFYKKILIKWCFSPLIYIYIYIYIITKNKNIIRTIC